MSARAMHRSSRDAGPRPMVAAFVPAPVRSPVVQPRREGGTIPVDAGRLGLSRQGGSPLPDAARIRMEAAFGANFSDMRIHVGPQADRIGAVAFTTGSDIFFAPGRYQPDSPAGLQLLGHELAHVIQQRAGRVRNPLRSGAAVVQDTALEAEADRLGRQAAMMRAVAPATPVASPLQRPAPGSETGFQAIQAKDRSARIVELMEEDVADETIRDNVASACNKVKAWAQGLKLTTIGRDIFFYSKMGWAKSSTVSELLEQWDPDSNYPSATAGMLADFALSWQRAPAGDGKKRGSQWREQYADTRPKAKQDKARQLLTGPEKAGRGGDHTFDQTSTYGQLAAQHGYAVKAGPSASTAQLLWMLRSIGTITNDEAKSVAHALAAFWNTGLKSWSGDYHTKFEVMIPLARHLGKGNKFQPNP